MILFRCPLCGSIVTIADAHAGQPVLCAVCRRCLRAPAAPAGAPPPPPAPPVAVAPPAWSVAPPPARRPAAQPAPPLPVWPAKVVESPKVPVYAKARQKQVLPEIRPANDVRQTEVLPEVLPADGVQQAEVLPEVLPAGDSVVVAQRASWQRRRRARHYPHPIYLDEQTEPPFFTFDRGLGLALVSAGLLLLIILTLIGSAFSALLFGGMFLILGIARFLLPNFMVGTRFAGLVCLLFGLALVVLINASDRKAAEDELGLAPFMLAYIGAAVFSTLGCIGLLRDY